jgi:ferritin-like metal-binding protein YciE
MTDGLRKQITKYLTDAHSIEQQSLSQLRTVPDIAGEPAFADALRRHLEETEQHETRIRSLLEARDEKPSRIKDAAMYAGGKGFVLFARSQPDTPGKLASHALSYEALEWASYDLLARTAERAGEMAVAKAARAIRDEERAMMERIEGLLERTADASLKDVGEDDLMDHLRSYLADAHAIEAQSIQLLESGREMVKDHPPLDALFDEHLAESRAQQELIEERLDAVGGSRSILKDAAMRFGALEWGTFFLGHPDTPGKLAGFAYAFEHLEIGGYEQLRRVAERAGDQGTVDAVTRILAEERAAADKLAKAFDAAVRASLTEQGVS